MQPTSYFGLSNLLEDKQTTVSMEYSLHPKIIQLLATNLDIRKYCLHFSNNILNFGQTAYNKVISTIHDHEKCCIQVI